MRSRDEIISTLLFRNNLLINFQLFFINCVNADVETLTSQKKKQQKN